MNKKSSSINHESSNADNNYDQEFYLIVSKKELYQLNKKLDQIIEASSDDLDDFMSMHDFLERFRIKRSTFYKYLDRQYFKLYKLGGSNYVKKSEIKNALERGMI